MSLEAIREQIVTILSSVDGVENVHQYQRWASTWEKFLDHFKDEATGKINGWTISREKTPAICESTTHDNRSHNFRIRGYYGLKDEDGSEIVFQDLIEDICAAFRIKYQLNNTASNTEPVQVEIVDLRMFGTVLCHYCELLLIAEEYENWS